MLTLIDNYDSFTFNLVQFLGDLSAVCEVVRNDKTTPDEVFAAKPKAIILSPGPCDPDKAGICLELIKAAPDDMPIFGVCLGHQCIGQAFGGDIVRADKIMHGKLSALQHNGAGVFDGLPDPLSVTRYHSLVIDPPSLPDCLEVAAQTDDGIIMAVRHKERPIYGVQFHPESIATAHGHKLLGNFLKTAGLNVAADIAPQHLTLDEKLEA
jgi:anthranilate synthase component 2